MSRPWVQTQASASPFLSCSWRLAARGKHCSVVLSWEPALRCPVGTVTMSPIPVGELLQCLPSLCLPYPGALLRSYSVYLIADVTRERWGAACLRVSLLQSPRHSPGDGPAPRLGMEITDQKLTFIGILGPLPSVCVC